MKRLLRISLFVLGVMFIAHLSACRIENAMPDTNKKLVVVSNFLTDKDTTFFTNFSKDSGTKVELKIMTAEMIEKTLEDKGPNAGFDLILTNSMTSINLLNKKNLLQSINMEDELSEDIQKYCSWKYNFVGLGINPFIVVQPVGAEKKFRTYDELIAGGFINNLDADQTTVFLSPYMHKMKKVDANKKILSFVKQARNSGISDSLQLVLPALMDLQKYNRTVAQDTILYGREITYPNQLTSGCFYGSISIAVADQAEHYTEAKEFILFYTQVEQNKTLNKQMGSISIHAAGKKVRLHSTKREQLVPYFELVQRSLKKLNYRVIN